jgi:hypothetical protein
VRAIALMIGIAFALHIPWLYFGAVIALSVWQEEERSKQATLRSELEGPHLRERIVIVEEINESKVVTFTLFRLTLGCHLAFVLQAVGMLLEMSDAIVVRMGYFMASLAIGLVIPFLLLSRKEEPSQPSTEQPAQPATSETMQQDKQEIT